jgi:hypothetical protein
MRIFHLAYLAHLIARLAPIVILCFSGASYADTVNITGTVLEKGSKRALADVQVVVREDERLSSITDEKGHFTLVLPGKGLYTFTALMIGAETPTSITIQINDNTPPPAPTIYLSPTAVLSEVIVSAARSPDRVSKTVITGAELRRIPGSGGDPLKSLQALPGVVASNGGAPAVRGSGPGDNLYYVDGLAIGKIFHFGGVSVFNGDLIRDFNLYSAAFAPRYGDATGAVLDVALRDPRNDLIGGKLNINMIGADALIEGPVNDNQSFFFAARRSYFDLLIKSVEQRGITVQIPNYSDYQGKYLWKLNATDRITLHAQGATDELKLNVGSNSEFAKQQPILSGDLSFSDSYTMQAGVWDATFGDTQNQLALEHISSNLNNTLAAAGTLNVGQITNLIRDTTHIPLTEKRELILSSSLAHILTSIDADIINTTCTQFQTNCDPSSFPRKQLYESFNSKQWELSAQNRERVSTQLTLIAGVHHSGEDYLGKSYTEPRIGAEWDWDEKTLLSAGWGRHNQLPTGQQLSRQFGNPQLDHLRAEHSVIGISKKLDDDWSWKSEAYYKKFSNLVISDAQLNYINGASGNAYGTELLIKKDGLSRLTGWLALSLTRSERQNDITGQAFRFQYDQPINTTLVTNYKLNDIWQMGAKWSYHSGTPYTPLVGRTQDSTGRYLPVYANINSGILPDYHRLDLRFERSYLFNTWKLNTYFELNNVYFRQNLSGYRYDSTYSTKEAVYPLVIPFSFGVQGEF